MNTEHIEKEIERMEREADDRIRSRIWAGVTLIAVIAVGVWCYDTLYRLLNFVG